MIVSELLAKLGLSIDKESFAKGGKVLVGLKAGLAGILENVNVGSVLEMVKGVGDLADAAVKSASKLGITAEAVQELGYAAEASDLSQEKLEAGLGRLSVNLREVARTGKGPAAEALWALKVPLSSLKKLSPDQQLAKIADAFEKLPPGAKKASIASGLFSRSLGTSFIPLLDSGADGIDELRNKAREMGRVVSTEVAKDFEAFNDKQTELAGTWQGMKTDIAVALLPSLNLVVDKIQDWMAKNRELIASGLEKFIKAISIAASYFATALEWVFKGLDWIVGGSDEAIAVLIALGIALAPVILAWLATAAATALATIQFVLIVAAIAAVVYGLMYLIKHPDKVKKAFKIAWEFIKEKADWLWQKLKGIGQSIADFFTETIPDGIKRAFNAAFEWLVNLPVIKQLIQLVQDIASIADIPKQFDTSNEKLIQDSAEAERNGTKDQFRAAHPEIFNQVLSPEEQAWLGRSGQAEAMPSNNFGDVNITINPAAGQSEKGIGDAVARRATDEQKRMLTDAHSRLRGGHR